MPSSLQYPLERHRDLQRRWRRLLQATATPIKPAPVDGPVRNDLTVAPGAIRPAAYIIGGTMPPRDPNNDVDDDEEDDDADAGEDLEPAVIREPDEDA